MKVRSVFIFILVCLTIFLSGCREALLIDSATFEEKWVNSRKHSAVSWWYLGESEDNYLISEKWPTRKTIYIIPKDNVLIKGIQSFKSDANHDPVNLKNHNVVFK
jgi:hypothetical protein